MSFDPSWLMLSLIPSGIGMVLFFYGKRQGRFPQLIVGILFMVYPFFTTTVTSLILVGIVLGLLLWYLLRTGRSGPLY
jgi:4-hydroxybenzoate polyprenyltransferase